jgi:hypothetical protein
VQTSSDLDSGTSTNITVSLMHKHLYKPINNTLENKEDSYSYASVSSKILNVYIKELESSHLNIIKDLPPYLQQMYLLHQTCIGLYKLNEYCFCLSNIEFRSRVLFPNLIYLMVRFLHKANGFIQKTIRHIYKEFKNQHYGIIKQFINTYYCDEDLIKSDVLYSFLGNAMRKFDPLTINKPQEFYRSSIRSILQWYLKNNKLVKMSSFDFEETDRVFSDKTIKDSRMQIYQNVLYGLYVKNVCKDSPVLMQMNYNYNIFKNVIINNEFQNLYLSTINNGYIGTPQYKLMHIYNDDNQLLKKIKNLPLIYKLIKSVHIYNSNAKTFNNKFIKFDLVKTIVLEQLLIKFKNVYTDQYVMDILDKIAYNFTDNILTGEYINLVTLNSIKISQISFVNQIKDFIILTLDEANIS